MFQLTASKPTLKQHYKSIAFLIGVLLPTTFAIAPGEAGQLSSGQVFFDQAPRLVRAATSSSSSSAPATYQFTLKVPENAGAPLQAVTIRQRENLETIEIDADESRAFEGDSFAGGPRLSLASVGGPDLPEGETTVMFDPPIEPGKTVTISLEAERNPLLGGIYLFGVTAYPTGDQTNGLFLGYGRLMFTAD
jgi:hypothetical protein